MEQIVSVKKYLDDLVKIHIINIRDAYAKDRDLVDWCTSKLFTLLQVTMPNLNNDFDEWKAKPFAYTTIDHNVSFGTLACKTTSITGTLTVSGEIYGTAQHARYSDLAERYASTRNFSPGYIVSLSDSDADEIELTTYDNLDNFLGVISTDPAFLMNNQYDDIKDSISNLNNKSNIYHIPVGLIGRVPIIVEGPVKKGSHITLNPDHAGIGIQSNHPEEPTIAIALESKTSLEIGLVLCTLR